jgi:hypothetical protein
MLYYFIIEVFKILIYKIIEYLVKSKYLPFPSQKNNDWVFDKKAQRYRSVRGMAVD